MSNFVRNEEHMRTVLLFAFDWKKTVAEGHRMLVEAHGEHALSETRCREWFRQFESGDFDVSDKKRPGHPKKFEEALLDEDARQTQKQLVEALNITQQTVSNRLKAMGKILKEGKWVPHELTERQMENRRTTSEVLLERYNRKSFLHRIVAGDGKWTYYENPKRKKSYFCPGEPKNINCKAESLWKEDNAVCLVGPKANWYGTMSFLKLVKRLMRHGTNSN